MPDPVEPKGQGSKDDGRSNLARSYQLAERYTGAAFTLVASVGVLAWLGHLADRRLGLRVPWFMLLGALVGMVGGFISFFRTVLGSGRDKK